MKTHKWQKTLAAAVLGAAMLAAACPAWAEAPAGYTPIGSTVSPAGSTQAPAAPRPTAITAAESTENSVTVQWQRRSKEIADGYQVQLAANAGFTQSRIGKMISGSANVSFTFDDLQSGTAYYVRVRTYKTVNGQNVFSAWSPVKTAATAQHRHTYENTVTKATLTADGKIVETCTGCGQTGKTTVMSHHKTSQLAKASFVYDGNIKKPAVTVTAADGKVIPASNYTVTYPNNSNAIGKHTCKIVFKGNYQGTVTREFTITPKGTVIENLTADDRSLTVQWAIRSKEVVSGYQVQYATDSNFTQNRVGKMIAKSQTGKTTVNGLNSSTKYYVRVRTYKTVNGQNVFSGWTETKEISTAKKSKIIASGYCGADGNYQSVSWTLDNNGKLTISGSGEMRDYIYDSVDDFHAYQDDIKSVAVEYGVTTIGEFAFTQCRSLTSITIPNSVTSIGQEAFLFCSSLTSITIPNSVTSIGRDAFTQCSGLTSVTLSNSLTSIAACTFYECSSLTSITIPNSVTLIGWEAFYGCSSLTSITIPKSVSTIRGRAFSDCGSLTSITIPNSVTSIEEEAFSGCNSLTSITIPNSVTSIEWGTFSACSSLTSITIPNSVTTIGGQAFSGCSSLTNIVIPSSVTSIEWGTFSGCSSLTNITIPNRVTSIEGRAFNECSSLTSITIPNSVASIGEYAFGYCSSLTSVTLPNSVTSIGKGAFYGCSGLTSITLPNSVTSIGEYAFSGCSGLTSITIPSSVTSIEWDTFYGCSSLTSVTLPNSVTSIRGRAFAGCSSLTNITIPKSVTSIGQDAFDRCSSLKMVRYTGTKAQWGSVQIDGGNDALTNAKIECTDGTI